MEPDIQPVSEFLLRVQCRRRNSRSSPHPAERFFVPIERTNPGPSPLQSNPSRKFERTTDKPRATRREPRPQLHTKAGNDFPANHHMNPCAYSKWAKEIREANIRGRSEFQSPEIRLAALGWPRRQKISPRREFPSRPAQRAWDRRRKMEWRWELQVSSLLPIQGPRHSLPTDAACCLCVRRAPIEFQGCCPAREGNP